MLHCLRGERVIRTFFFAKLGQKYIELSAIFLYFITLINFFGNELKCECDTHLFIRLKCHVIVSNIIHIISVDDIFLNSLLVTLLNKAFKTLLLKFAILILPSSPVANESLGFFQPTSTTNYTFSSRVCKKSFHTNFSVRIVSTIK